MLVSLWVWIMGMRYGIWDNGIGSLLQVKVSTTHFELKGAVAL